METFDRVQEIFDSRPRHRSDDQLLDGIKSLLAKEGRLSVNIIDASRKVPSASKLADRFGTIRQMYRLIGYEQKRDFYERIRLRTRTQRLRDKLVRRIASMFRGEVLVLYDDRADRRGNTRPLIQFIDGPTVSVVVCRTIRTALGNIRWKLDPAPAEAPFATLLVRLNANNDGYHDFHVLPAIPEPHRHRNLKEDAPEMRQAYRLRKLRDFSKLVKLVKKAACRHGAN